MWNNGIKRSKKEKRSEKRNNYSKTEENVVR